MTAGLNSEPNEAETDRERRKRKKCTERSRYGKTMLSLGAPGGFSASIPLRLAVSPGRTETDVCPVWANDLAPFHNIIL